MTVRTRFAPSPTGSLHVGGAHTALYCWLHARKHDGAFLLRIEDTDRARSTDEAAAGILRDMRWLGLDWDEGPGAEDAGTGPYFQSQRLEAYDAVLAGLLERDVAYEAWDSREELDAQRAEARAAKENFIYRRRPVSDAEVEAYRAEGRVPVVRLTAPNHAVHVVDEVLGEVSVAVDMLEDIVVRKADGFPTYHFAVVVDDHQMGVSLVMRGQEHLLNTPKHLGLYEALGWQPPAHAHLPTINSPGGGKMSKRDKAKAARAGARAAANGRKGSDWLAEELGVDAETLTLFMKKKDNSVGLAKQIAGHLGLDLPLIDVMDFRRGGFLPEGLLNYLALLGWSPGNDLELMTMAEMVDLFSLDRVKKTAATFDIDKLTAMNAEHIRRATIDRLAEAHDAYLEVREDSHFQGMDDARRRRFLALYQPRMTTFGELERSASFFFVAPTTWAPKAVKKHLLKGGGLARLAAVREVLDSSDAWTAEALDAAMSAWAEAQELNMGKVAQPVRVAVTGTGVSPGMGDTLELLGREATLSRIDACLAHLEASDGQ
jgi:glutamyl-tRNA synthetase